MSNKEFYRFTKAQFDYYMGRISEVYQIPMAREITKEIVDFTKSEIKEYVYSVQMPNKYVDILIYTAIDLRTDEMRDNGSDAIRLVMRWKTKNWYVCKKISKHLRLRTMFVNIRKSLLWCMNNSYNLNYSEFRAL